MTVLKPQSRAGRREMMREDGISGIVRLSSLSHSSGWPHETLCISPAPRSAASHPRTPHSPTAASGNLPRQVAAGDSVGLVALNIIVQACGSFPSTAVCWYFLKSRSLGGCVCIFTGGMAVCTVRH